MNQAPVTREITMTLLEDIETAIKHVSRDFLPTKQIQTFVAKDPPSVTLKITGAATPELVEQLHELAKQTRVALQEAIPSLPLRFTVIGASLAAGIIITPEEKASPSYGNIIKARLAWLRPSSWLRNRRPSLPERFDL